MYKRQIYGGSYNLFAVTMKRMGLSCTFVDPDCSAEELNAAFRPNTKAVSVSYTHLLILKTPDLRPETLCIQAGYTPGNGEPRQIPIIQSTTFRYETSEAMGKLFDLEADGYFYSRLQNPTCDHVAAKIAALEGGTAAMLTGSGQAAILWPCSTSPAAATTS